MTLFSKTGKEADYIEWWQEKQKSRQDKTLFFRGLNIQVKKNIFSPDPAETISSSMILDELPHDLTGKRILDIGAGSGVLGLYSLKQQAEEVIFVDCDDQAISNIQYNLHAHNFPGYTDIKHGDLFADVEGKFDIILANLPIVDAAWPQIKGGTQNIYTRFMRELPKYLAQNGSCFLCFASFGDIENFEKLTKSQFLQYHIKNKQEFSINWYLIKLFHTEFHLSIT